MRPSHILLSRCDPDRFDPDRFPASRRVRLREWVYRVFDDRLMIELGLLSIPPVVLPLFFDFSPAMRLFFALVNGLIVALFAVEYVLKCALAPSPLRYAINPWHLLDLLIIVGGSTDFWLAQAPRMARASPALRLFRLLRIARAFALAGRTVGRAMPSHQKAMPDVQPIPLRVCLREEGILRKGINWTEAHDAVRDPRETWLDVQGLSEMDHAEASRVLKIPSQVFKTKLTPDALPDVDYFANLTVLLIWDWPSDADAISGAQPAHNPVLVLCAPDYLATVSPAAHALFDRIGGGDLPLEGETFSVRVLYAILQTEIADYRKALQTLEIKVAELEEESLRKPSRRFLDESFRLKRLVQKHDYNLRHFAMVLDNVRSRGVSLPNVSEAGMNALALCHDGAETLVELCRGIRDNIMTLIDLQMNRVSLEMNRVMRVLATISCVSLIPAVIGGLLGENLVDQPFGVTLPEVMLLVGSLMGIGLYAFYRMGWFK